MDTLTKEKRSQLMSRVRGKNTRPERIVRRVLHSLGFRFRLHRRDLPGRPDIVLPRLKVAFFVHGCFWHRHARCKKATTPASNREFWQEKFRQNQLRDRKKTTLLKELGWKVVVIWECETANLANLIKRLQKLLPCQERQP